MVKAKGLESYAVERVAKEIINLGCSKFVLKDDQEPSIKALREAVIRRITALKGDLDIQIIPEESPVGESQSNGEVESAIKQVQGQFRTMRLSMQSSYQQIIPDDHIAALWLLPHSAQTLNRYLVGQDGKTARQRLRGRTFKALAVEFGECVWHLRLKSAGKDKMNTRWGSGVWLGIREESNEVFVGTDEGVVKCRSIRRKAGPDRWDKDLFNSIKGTPWEPMPGRLSIEVPINVRVPDEDQVIMPQTLSQEKDIVRRDFRIYKSDVKDYGLTPGCRGCLAADAGSLVARNHTPECRKRFMTIFEKNPEQMQEITEQYII